MLGLFTACINVWFVYLFHFIKDSNFIMFDRIKIWWKYSSFRFYCLNAKHNYDFWLNSRRVFTTIEYLKFASHLRSSSFKKQKKKRFVGYEYKGKIYLDNPGISIKERDVWEKWKEKGLI